MSNSKGSTAVTFVLGSKEPPRDSMVKLLKFLEMHQTLEDVLRWRRQENRRPLFDDIVMQDEFSYDVLIRHPLGGQDVYIVYDSTCSGGINGISVWDRRPERMDMLEARLRRGWAPTPSPLKGGHRVLGFAASAA